MDAEGFDAWAEGSRTTFIERRVLQLVCERGPYLSAVVLWSDYTGRQGYAPLFEDLLLELDRRGLLVYALGERNIPVRIRATAAGYDAAGLPRRRAPRMAYAVGAYERPGPTPDMTEWRHHQETARGDGPIERESLRVHVIRFPDHVHEPWVRAAAGGTSD